MGFDMASEPKTGAFLKTLAATKPGGNFLEIGTGTGLSAAWILLGMSHDSVLTSIDNDEAAQDVARKYLGSAECQDNCRLKLICTDGGTWLEQNQQQRYDFIFADAFPGKFSQLDLALNLTYLRLAACMLLMICFLKLTGLKVMPQSTDTNGAH